MTIYQIETDVDDDREYNRLWAEANAKLDAAGMKPVEPEGLPAEPRDIELGSDGKQPMLLRRINRIVCKDA